jgi:Zn-dependent protease
MVKLNWKIPVSIHPFFWVIAGLIGWLNSGSFLGTLIWILVILVSVLFHEFGHALTACLFGQKPKIALIAMGGVTSYENRDLKFWKQFLIVLNGPLFGVLLFFIASFILYLKFFENIHIVNFFRVTQVVNLFWSVVNLLPVLPLDGGQLLRIALEACLGVKGFRLSIFIGMIIALLLSVFFFIKGGFLIGAIFFLFAFQSFDSWRKSKFLTQADRDVGMADLLKEGEKALAEGRKEEAEGIFEEIRKKTKRGILYSAASHYLALLKLEKGERKEAYDLLLEVKDSINHEAIFLLHELGFENKNYKLVTELSAKCYQARPSFEIAIRSARAFAALGKARPAGGWLQTALKEKEVDVKEILKEEEFQGVLGSREFQKFF